MVRIAVVVVLVLATVASAKRRFIPPPNAQIDPSEKEMAEMPGLKKTAQHRAVGVIPDSFDSRTKWPKCKSISTIRQQGQCGTCWAVSGASVLSDRICIASGQTKNIFISANQAASCSQPEKSGEDNCNAGGDAQNVYKFATLYGISTGGEYNTEEGCVPYSVAPNAKPPVYCAKQCTNADYTVPLEQDKYAIESYWANYKPSSTVMTAAQIEEAKKQIQTDMMVNGPLTVSIKVYSDFQDWEAGMAPYCNPGPGAESMGGHAVRLVGWGKTAKGVSYWIIANSWGTDAGDKGYYWVEMGKNCVGIERTISAPVIAAPNTCSTASFCDKDINQALNSVPSDAKSPAYLFQGNCTLKISVGADGKLTPAQAALPIGSEFIGGPSGPITSYIVQDNQMWLINKDGKAGADCKMAKGAKKISCGGGTGTAGQVAQAVIPGSMAKWSYYADNAQWLFNTQGKGTHIADLITKFYTSVQALLNVDGKKMIVFGKDKAGKPSAGVLAYPSSTQAGFVWVTQPGPLKNMFTKCA